MNYFINEKKKEMKKLIVLLFVICCYFNLSGQIKTNEPFKPVELKCIGIPTEDKDTLYLLDCPTGKLIEEFWLTVTDIELKSDGITEPPKIIMIENLSEFKTILFETGQDLNCYY